MAFTLYTMAEAADYLSIEKETLRNRVKVNNLPVFWIGELQVITKDDLDRLKDMGPPRKGRPPKRRS